MKKTLILGSGISGMGAAKLLRKQNIPVILSDLQNISDEKHSQLSLWGVEIKIGPQDHSLLENIDRVIPSPGISMNSPIIEECHKRSIAIVSDIQLARDNFKGHIIGVTGTNGKSTTVELISWMLNKIGKKSLAVGNVGRSPCEILAEGIDIPEYFVMELSSYQLETCENLNCIATVFTSFAIDHLERHTTMDNYFLAKWRLIHQTQKTAILSSAFARHMNSLSLCPPPFIKTKIIGTKEVDDDLAQFSPLLISYDQEKIELDGKTYGLPNWGFHNKINFVFSLLAIKSALEVVPDNIAELCRDFPFLSYRFQKIGTSFGKPIFNDSKATNVEATIVAMRSMTEPFYVLWGGRGKGEPYGNLDQFADRVISSFCFGYSGKEIADQLKLTPKSCHTTLKEALEGLRDVFIAHPAPILFSPGCASFDEFRNFEDRGHYFNQVLSKFPEFISETNSFLEKQ